MSRSYCIHNINRPTFPKLLSYMCQPNSKSAFWRPGDGFSLFHRRRIQHRRFRWYRFCWVWHIFVSNHRLIQVIAIAPPSRFQRNMPRQTATIIKEGRRGTGKKEALKESEDERRARNNKEKRRREERKNERAIKKLKKEGKLQPISVHRRGIEIMLCA